MFSLEIDCPPDAHDLLVADLWEAGSAGIVELDGGRLRAFFEDGADRKALAARFRAAAWRTEEGQDWVAISRADWEPLAVGERFFLVPEWRSDPAPEGRFRIVVNPGMAFGTGRHESTQLCLEVLETHVGGGTAMLDVGTGSGILAEAARLLGAGPVWGCDIDALALEVARNKAGGGLFVGSADAVRAGAAGLITANISAAAVMGLTADLLRCLRPDGVALLSGFDRSEAEGVEAEWLGRGGEIHERRHKGEWALLAGVRGRRVA